jgi:transcriptional regulator GlxA family with amidase domain
MMLYAGFRLLEVTGPMEVFHEANRLGGAALYEQHLVGASPGSVLCSNGVAVGATESLSQTRNAFDIVVVPGSQIISSSPEHGELVDWLSEAGRSVSKLASVSTGAFLVARTGLADHHTLTVNWRHAPRLTAEYPLVRVLSDQRCLKDGNLYSSCGFSDGMQLALALVREDHGKDFARSIAESLSRQRH